MTEKVSLFVPGRICLFGEHSDWAGHYMGMNTEIVEGQAIVSGINLGIYAEAYASSDFVITTRDENDQEVFFSCKMELNELREKAEERHFFAYCCGVAAYIKENYHVGGIRINVTRVTLPMKKGLSSSAAICCLVAKAFNQIYHLHINTNGIMNIAYHGELLTGSRCGRLDQACAYGEQPVLMHFRYDEVSVDKLHVGETMYWVIADLCAGKDTRKILAYLNKAYPFATNDMEMREQEALGKDNHEIISKAKIAIESGNTAELGKVMDEAQTLFDAKIAPMCPDELTSPVLHSVLNDPYVRTLIYGAKGVGSQGDGTVQLLAKDKHCQERLIEYLNNERKMVAFPFTLVAGGKVRKAIIPIAGLGTRMFPETWFTKKALLPIINGEGIVKPVLLQLLEELDSAGIEDIYLIVGEGEEEDYCRLFKYEVSEEYVSHLPEYLKSMYYQINEIGRKLHFVVQEEKRGLGHAVYQARKYLKGEPAIVLLGDFVYSSNLKMSCVQQTINAYTKNNGKNVVAIKQVDCCDSCHYGILHGEFMPDRPYIMSVDHMMEKPSKEYAEEHLAINGNCYATFGQYILTDEVFQYLEKQIMRDAAEEVHSAEIDLTKALQECAKEGRLMGVLVDGTSYDVGIPEKYYETFVKFKNVNT